ncbi:hypothetical protein GN958_ATG03728, partial [Phytophthora infestans]
LINLDESSNENEEVSDENVRPSQIDCSLIFDDSEAMAGADTEGAAQTADIAQQSPGTIELSDEDAVVGALQRMLSEAESEGHVHFSDNERKQDEGERVEKASTRCPHQSGRHEHSDEFACMDSSNSGDGDDDDDCEGDDEVERREYLEDDDELPDDELKLADEAFVASLGGSLAIANIDKDALRLTSWREQSSLLEIGRRSYQ